jgi:hypothetical protein
VTPKELKATYRSALTSDDGRKMLDDLSARFGIWKSSYTPNSDETAWREGQREVVLFMHAMLKDHKPNRNDQGHFVHRNY